MEQTGIIEVEGEKREEVLKNVAEKIKEWGLKMPAVFSPLVLDFGVGNFSQTGHTEYLIVNDEENGYCGKFLFLFKEQSCPAHYHQKKHETFMVVKGEISMHLESQEIKMRQGDVLPMPQKTWHSFTAIEDALILEVSLPSVKGDNFFKDKKIGVL